MQRSNHIKAYFNTLPFSLSVSAGLVVIISGFQLLQQFAHHLSNGFDFEFSWLDISSRLLIGNTVWLIISPILYHIALKISSLSNVASSQKMLVALLLFPVALIQNSSALWLYNFSYYLKSGYMRSFFGANNQTDLVTGLFSSFIEGVVIIGIFLAVEYQRKLANKERDLAKAQLNALKMQLHPHFLFNTLHSISSMIDLDVKKAQKMITKVGDLLRRMLLHDQMEYVTLKQEIDFIRNYLELEQIRFQDRMNVVYDIDEQLTTCKVPNLILQPLVENCVKHGVSKNPGVSTISVKASFYQNGTNSNWLKLEIDNEVEDAFRTRKDGFGIGLKNVEKRLAQLYADRFNCDFKNLSVNHFKSEIRIPLAHD